MKQEAPSKSTLERAIRHCVEYLRGALTVGYVMEACSRRRPSAPEAVVETFERFVRRVKWISDGAI